MAVRAPTSDTPIPDEEIRRDDMRSGDSHELIPAYPAIILYPALMTPAIVVGEEPLEILMLTHRNYNALTPERVAIHLKISPGLQPGKPYTTAHLPLNLESPDEIDEKINVELLGVMGEQEEDRVFRSHSRFKGLLDKRAVQLFARYGFRNAYRVQINIPGLFETQEDGRGLFNLIWVHAFPGQPPGAGVTSQHLNHYRQRPTGNDETEPVWVPNEIHDQLVWGTEDGEGRPGTDGVLGEENGDNLPEYGKFCFNGRPNLGIGLPALSTVNLLDPVQTYHPVFYWEQLSKADIGHISDMHLCARQHVLAQSTARVVEWEDEDNVCPDVGELLNVSLHNFNALLNEVGSDPAIDIVLLGGDLIDYVKSLYMAGPLAQRNVSQIWDAVSLASGYDARYQDNVDYMSFYTAIIDFYRSHRKPAFVVTGNHDCYYEPYGISPRLRVQVRSNEIDLKRANEGIPADHNISFFEAILIFGDTYHMYYESTSWRETNSTNFLPEKLAWFYGVLTPFSDFAFHLQRQCIAGLGWGDREDMINLRDVGSQGGGHLPRSKEALSERQRTFMEDVQNGKGSRTMILTTHFTFISYKGTIPLDTTEEGHVVQEPMDTNPSQYGHYDEGTFEENRPYLYGLIRDGAIGCVLTGHSHRKAIYTIEGQGHGAAARLVRSPLLPVRPVITTYNRTQSYNYTGYSDYDGARDRDATLNGENETLIIVSDSAGPIPRFNRNGELNGFGSDRPSATKLRTNGQGAVHSIQTMPAPDTGRTAAKPRFAVSMDYFELYELVRNINPLDGSVRMMDHRVLERFRSDNIYIYQEQNPSTIGSLDFHVVLHDRINDLVYIQAPMVLYLWRAGQGWTRMDLTYDDASNRWRLRDVEPFLESTGGQGRAFLAIRFGPRSNREDRLQHYDFESYWCFRVSVDSTIPFLQVAPGSFREKYFEIERDMDRAEVPEFQWRRDAFGEKYEGEDSGDQPQRPR